MTKKSAASMKPAEPKQEIVQEEPKPVIMPIEEQFEGQWEYEKNLIDQQLVCVKRIDFSADLRQDWHEFFGTFPEYNVTMYYRGLAIKMIEKMRDIVYGYKFEDFCSEDWTDKMNDLIVTPEKCDEDEHLWWAYMTFKIARPFGEHACSLHTLVMELKKTENA